MNTWREKDNAFTVSGAYELKQPQTKATTSSLSIFSKTYAHMDYDLVALTSEEVEQLSTVHSDPKFQKGLPSGWMQFSDTAQTAIFTHDGVRIGFVIFPEQQPPQAPKDPSYYRTSGLSQAIQTVKDSCDLSIGLSAWGWKGEQDFLNAETPAPAILLGSGSGPAKLGQLANNGHTLWMRPYSMGRAVHVITIPNPLEKNWADGWRVEDTIHVEFMLLDDRVPQDPNIQDLLMSE